MQLRIVPCISLPLQNESLKTMRLDDFDPNINVEDQGRGGGSGGGGGGGLLFGLLPLIGSRFGCGGIVVVLIVMALFGASAISVACWVAARRPAHPPGR